MWKKLRLFTYFTLSFYILILLSNLILAENKKKAGQTLLQKKISDERLFHQWNYKNYRKRKNYKNYTYSNRYKLININTANIKLLTRLPHIGVQTAKKIIRYRKTKGLFYFKEDIRAIRGIGAVKYNRLKNRITIGKVNIKKRFQYIHHWTMEEFINIGFSPSLSLRSVLFIRDRELFHRLDDLLKLKGFNQSQLKRVRKKLKSFSEL